MALYLHRFRNEDGSEYTEEQYDSIFKNMNYDIIRARIGESDANAYWSYNPNAGNEREAFKYVYSYDTGILVSDDFGKRTARTKLRLTNYDEKWSYKDVMFNPESFGDTKSASYSTINAPMQSYPRHVFNGGEVSPLNGVELFYHHPNPQKVREMVLWLQDFVPRHDGGVLAKVPPTLLFTWGDWYAKRCIVKSFTTNYTLFDEDLRPTELTISMDLEVVPLGMPPYQAQEWETTSPLWEGYM